MGVQRYLLAPMVTGLIAQRLVRRLCAACRVEDFATAADGALLDGALTVGDTIFRPIGCPECHNEGYRGRMGLYEVIAIDREMEAMIHDGASEAALAEAARRAGPSMLDDGIAKLRTGDTSVTEVARVVRD